VATHFSAEDNRFRHVYVFVLIVFVCGEDFHEK
jgi:hypothetical protein